MEFTQFDLAEEVMMADNVFYNEDIKKEPEDQRPRSLSLSITKPDFTSMLNTGEKSFKFTDQLLDTPEILSQSLDWQLHSRYPETEMSQYLPQTIDETTQITAIKNELQQDYENVASPNDVVATSPYYADTDHTYIEVEDVSSRAGDGSVSPTYSEAPSSTVADDEGDDDYNWQPNNRRRPGRPKSSSSNSTRSGKSKSEKRKLSDIDKDSEEYRAKRRRNNVAVRKSRDKAKRHHIEVEEKNKELQKVNSDLKKQNESLVREVTVLRKLITDIGRKVPDRLNHNLAQFST